MRKVMLLQRSAKSIYLEAPDLLLSPFDYYCYHYQEKDLLGWPGDRVSLGFYGILRDTTPSLRLLS